MFRLKQFFLFLILGVSCLSSYGQGKFIYSGNFNSNLDSERSDLINRYSVNRIVESTEELEREVRCNVKLLGDISKDDKIQLGVDFQNTSLLNEPVSKIYFMRVVGSYLWPTKSYIECSCHEFYDGDSYYSWSPSLSCSEEEVRKALFNRNLGNGIEGISLNF